MDPRGMMAALAAAASWAIASIAIARLLEHGRVTPAAANLFKNGLAASFFFVAALAVGGTWPVGAAWGWLFLSGLLGFAIADTLYFAAFRRCGVQTAATVLLLNVPVASLLAVPIVGDQLSPAVVPHMAIVAVGVILVILDASSQGGDGAKSRGSYLVGVLLALLAAGAIGLALPLGRHRFDDVGVWPGSFIRLAGGAFGAVPLAALSGLRRGTTPGAEVGALVEPLFRAPGPASVWGRTALFGVGIAILGLIPYHFALRELPSGIASILFSTTPLFTLPLALFVRQRVGIAGVLGSIIGFVGVAGVLIVEHGLGAAAPVDPRPEVEWPRPDVIPLSIDAPEGTRFPTFVRGAARPAEPGRAPQLPPLLAIQLGEGDGGAASDEDPREGEPKLLLLGFDEYAGPSVQSVLDGLGADSARLGLHVHFANSPRAARLPSGGLVVVHPEGLSSASLEHGVQVSMADGGPPMRSLGWLQSRGSITPHGFACIVAGDAGGNAVLTWLDERSKGSAADAALEGGEGGAAPSRGRRGAVQLRSRVVTPSGDILGEELLDASVASSCPLAGVRLEDGSVLVAYRNRGQDDLVDIAVTRRDPRGSWSLPVAVHGDDWRFSGPLVNGPAVAVDGGVVAVAWYLQVERGEPAVRVAFSHDGGRTFDPPESLAVGKTQGQVALAGIGNGSFALVHGATPPADADPGAPGSWQVALVGPGRRASEFVRVGALLGRSSGRLDLAQGPPGVVFAAWTGPSGLEAARITYEREGDLESEPEPEGR